MNEPALFLPGKFRRNGVCPPRSGPESVRLDVFRKVWYDRKESSMQAILIKN